MTGFFLLLLAALPCVGKGPLKVTGSSTTAVAGHPFTFTCSRSSLFFNSWYYNIVWTAQLPNETSSFSMRTYIDDECRYYFNQSEIYNFKCSPNGPFTLTILDVDFPTHQNSNWTCSFERVGSSNTVLLDVNVPLKTINLLTPTTNVLNLTEGDRMLLECETNPTKPPSNIMWMKGDDIITTGASSSTRDDGGLTVTVGRLSMEVTRELHMTRICCVGSYKETRLRTNEILLHIDVPLVGISMINPTNLPLAMTESDDVTLVCETNPLSTIIWTKGNQVLTEGVTSVSRARDGAVVAVSMATFTVSCDDHLSRIQCSGFYKDARIASKSQTLFVHCISKDENTGLTFSVGVGVGMTCLVPFLVAATVYIVWWKRRRRMKEKPQALQSTSRTAPLMSGDGHPPNFYECMDENTRERKETTYEELQMQVYENTRSAN